MKFGTKIVAILSALGLATVIISATATLAVAQPSEVWVDDDYCDSCYNNGHTWGYDAFDRIQDGIDAILTPGTVHVAAGTYFENVVLKGGAIVRGAGADITTIDGNENGSVVIASSAGPGTELDGFTITNGTGTWHGGYTYGGGIHISNSSLIVRNTIITSNSCSDGAGGIEAYDSTLSLFNNNIFQNNGWWGGAITLHSSDAEIVGNIIYENSFGYGGVIWITDNSLSTIVNNKITGNSIGIGIGESSTADIINNTICNNSNYGIATDTYLTGGEKGLATIINCIIWLNDDDLVNLTATYSNIEDADFGEGNISLYPMFVDLAAGDYHLKKYSPCIDAGTNDAPSLPDTDCEDNPRIIDGDNDDTATVDMGAYEFGDICECDFEGDLDIDGIDLATYVNEPGSYNLAVFAEDFARTDCPVFVTYDVFTIGGYLQYRTFSDGSNQYRGWLEFAKNENPIEESGITQIELKDSEGNPVALWFRLQHRVS
jgi:nitrous oxidase accessory protein NosD